MKKTALYDTHVSAGAKIVEFAGYAMPVQYKDGILKEHLQVREYAGLFDVSHMGQALITGAGAIQFAEKITPSTFATLAPMTAKYTVLSNPQNGIIDDLIITKITDDKLFVVYNAGCKEKDEKWIRENLPKGLEFQTLSRSLLALQGAQSETILSKIIPETSFENQKYMSLQIVRSADFGELYISRLGYTGEDGFEISVSENRAAKLWNEIIENGAAPIGLGARDSLRLEMGYPLYGHDINDETTPIEAALHWIMPKAKREEFGEVKNLRVGFDIADRSILREGVEVFSKDGTKIGKITSGGFSPSLQKPIAQGYVEKAFAEIGTEVEFELRGRKISGKVAPINFLPANTKAAK